MTLNEMVCHCTDQLKMAIGVFEAEYIGNKVQSTILKQIILLGMPIPKGKIETTKELSQEKNGTKPKEFRLDKNELIKFIEDFNIKYDNSKRVVHPAFGQLNKKQWARLAWLHLDHHLRQFGA